MTHDPFPPIREEPDASPPPPPPPSSVPPLPGSGRRGAPPVRPVGSRVNRGHRQGQGHGRDWGTQPGRPQPKKKKTSGWLIGLLIFLVIGAIGRAVRDKPDREFNTDGKTTAGAVGGEFAEKPGAGLDQLSAADRTRITEVAVDVVRATQLMDSSIRLDDVVNFRRMVWETLLHASPKVRRQLERDIKKLTDGMRKGFSGQIVARQGLYANVRLETVTLHRVEMVPERPEVVTYWRVFADPMDGSGTHMSRLVMWLIRDDKGWRMYDIAITDDVNIRVSAAMGSVLTTGLTGNAATRNRISRKIPLVNALLMKARSGVLFTVAEVDPLIGDRDLVYAQPALRVLRLLALTQSRQPPATTIAYAQQVLAAPDCPPVAHLGFANWQFLRARVHNDIDLYGSAAEHYQAFIKEVGPDPETSLSLGSALTWLDQWPEARAAWQEWIDIAHEVGMCHLEAARYDADYGRVSECIGLLTEMQHAGRYRGNFADIIQRLYNNCDGERHGELIVFLTRPGISLPADCQATLAELLVYEERFDEALVVLSELVMTHNDDDREDALRTMLRCGEAGCAAVLELLPQLVAAGQLSDTEVWEYRGRALIETGRQEDGHAVYVEAMLHGGPGNGPLEPEPMLLAIRLLADGAAALIATVEQLPADAIPAEAWPQLTRAYEKLERPADVLRIYRAAVLDTRLEERGRANALRWMLDAEGGLAATVDVLDAIDASEDLKLNVSWWYRGITQERLGQADDARRHYGEVVLDTARDTGQRTTALHQLARHNMPQQLVDLFTELLDADSPVVAPTLHARCLIDLGRKAEAAKILAAIAGDAEADPGTRRAALETMIDDADAAREALGVLRFAERTVEGADVILFRLLAARATAAIGGPDEALQACFTVLSDKEFGESYMMPALRTMVDIEPGGPQAVLARLEAMSPEQRSERYAWNLHGKALRALGRHREALAIYDAAMVALEENDQTYRLQSMQDRKLETLIETGDAATAAALAGEWAASQDDSYYRSWRRLMHALALTAAGRTDEALPVLEAARVDNPDLIDRLPARYDDLKGIWTDPVIGPWLQAWYTETHGIPPILRD